MVAQVNFKCEDRRKLDGDFWPFVKRALLPRGLFWQSGINMPIFLIAWLMAAALVAASPVDAGFLTGDDVMAWVNADDRTESGSASSRDYNQSYMLFGYVAGVYDAWQGFDAFCPPAGIALGKAVGIFKNYLKDNPAK